MGHSRISMHHALGNIGLGSCFLCNVVVLLHKSVPNQK